MNKYLTIVAGVFMLALTPLSRAGDHKDFAQVEDTFPFKKGTTEFQIQSGAFVSFAWLPVNRGVINYNLNILRVGRMISDPNLSGFLRGNSEFLLEAFGGPVYQGPGNGLVGGSLMYRYNFVQPSAKWIPYFQLGAGALYNDIYKDQDQRLIGEGFEFVLHASVGVHYMITDRWAVSAEGGYRHISNADMADRNVGLNSLGGTLGVTWFY